MRDLVVKFKDQCQNKISAKKFGPEEFEHSTISLYDNMFISGISCYIVYTELHYTQIIVLYIKLVKCRYSSFFAPKCTNTTKGI